jgi:signal transduction histidine kinase
MEAIGHLAGGIAHDFNNILTAAMGYVTLAQELTRDRGDVKLDRYLDRAQRASQRARNLIQQILTFSRGRRGDPRPLDLAPLVRETLRLLGATLAAEERFTEFRSSRSKMSRERPSRKAPARPSAWLTSCTE